MREQQADAEALVRATRYPPRGTRGFGLAVALASGYGLFPERYLDKGPVFVTAMIESRAGAEAARAIAEVDGIDAVLVGLQDPAADVRCDGGVTDPMVQGALTTVEKAVPGAGKSMGAMIHPGADAHQLYERGHRFITLRADTRLLSIAMQLQQRIDRNQRPGRDVLQLLDHVHAHVDVEFMVHVRHLAPEHGDQVREPRHRHRADADAHHAAGGRRVGMHQHRFSISPTSVRTALTENQVMFFRDQRMSVDQHKTFMRHFGVLFVHPASNPVEGHRADPHSCRRELDQGAGEERHTATSCERAPPMGSIPQMHTVREVGGDTLFAGMYAAYEALSPTMTATLDPLTAHHSGGAGT